MRRNRCFPKKWSTLILIFCIFWTNWSITLKEKLTVYLDKSNIGEEMDQNDDFCIIQQTATTSNVVLSKYGERIKEYNVSINNIESDRKFESPKNKPTNGTKEYAARIDVRHQRICRTLCRDRSESNNLHKWTELNSVNNRRSPKFSSRIMRTSFHQPRSRTSKTNLHLKRHSNKESKHQRQLNRRRTNNTEKPSNTEKWTKTAQNTAFSTCKRAAKHNRSNHWTLQVKRIQRPWISLTEAFRYPEKLDNTKKDKDADEKQNSVEEKLNLSAAVTSSIGNSKKHLLSIADILNQQKL